MIKLNNNILFFLFPTYTLLLAAITTLPLTVHAQYEGLIAEQRVTVIDRTGISPEAEDPVAFGK